MEYICHKRYKKRGASGKAYLFRRGKKLETVGRFICTGPEAVCAIRSEDAFRHFARNDDGNGFERGKLTFAIAYAKRQPNKENGFRFTEQEVDMLETEYPHFLRRDVDTLIFNEDFFNADIGELKELYQKLEVR